MSNAVLVPFHKQQPTFGQNHKVLLKLFSQHAKRWLQHANKLYIIDSGCSFSADDVAELGDKVVMVTRRFDSHWENLNIAIRESVTETNIAILDSDTVVYNDNVILQGFNKLQEFDAGGIFDTSGDNDLSQFEIMASNQYRAARQRLCPYLCFFRRDALRDDFDFTATSGPGYFDSMGRITLQMLQDGKRLFELPDDRSSTYLEDANNVTSTQWLDSPTYLWSKGENPNYGYYHLRNFSGGLVLLNTYYTNILTHKHFASITPRREALRLLAWVWVAHEIGKQDTGYIMPAINSFCDANSWHMYLAKFKQYHDWIATL